MATATQIPANKIRTRRQRVAATVVFVVLCLGALVELQAVAHIIPRAWSDMYPQWAASKAAIHGEDPYSLQVTREIQEGFYGHVLQPSDKWDQQNFVYPAHAVLLLAPFTALPWGAVRLIFLLAGIPAVAISAWLWLKISAAKRNRFGAFAFAGAVLVSWPSVWALQQQQPTIFIFLLISLGVYLFVQQRDVGAGILLSLATVKPNLVSLLAVWLLIVAARQRRWAFPATFGISTAFLIAVSEAVVPGWISRWIDAVTTYANDPAKASLLGHLFGHLGGFVATAVLLAALCFRVSLKRTDARAMIRSTAIILAASVCIMPTTIWMVYNNLLLVPAAALLISDTHENCLTESIGRIAAAVLGLMLLIVPVCAALFLCFPYRPAFALLPFFEYLVPLSLAAFALVVPITVSKSQSVAARL